MYSSIGRQGGPHSKRRRKAPTGGMFSGACYPRGTSLASAPLKCIVRSRSAGTQVSSGPDSAAYRRESDAAMWAQISTLLYPAWALRTTQTRNFQPKLRGGRRGGAKSGPVGSLVTSGRSRSDLAMTNACTLSVVSPTDGGVGQENASPSPLSEGCSCPCRGDSSFRQCTGAKVEASTAVANGRLCRTVVVATETPGTLRAKMTRTPTNTKMQI